MSYPIITLKKLDQPVRHIYHLSDIHLRNHSRHEEYRGVFEKLYDNLKSEPPGLIVITGDVVHSKSQISPQLIIELREFLTNLCLIMPVIMIAGNHDLNLSNKNIPDTLTSILHKMEVENLYYLKKSGFYRFNDVCFSVMSVLDYPLIRASEFPPEMTHCRKIGLLHATLNGSRISTSHIPLTSETYTATDFVGYEAVLLGDIHLHQYLNKEKTIAYAGSLIQQSFGETLTRHGYLKWDLRAPLDIDKSPEEEFKEFKVIAKLIEIPNDYGYVNLYLREDRIGPEALRFPACTQLRLKIRVQDESSHKVVDDYLADLSARGYTILQQVVIPYNPELKEAAQTSDVEVEETPNLLNVNHQEKLMKEYLGDQVDDDKVNELTQIHRNLSQQLELPEETLQSRWKLLKIEFENILTFKGSNSIDFKKYQGMVGIFGPNFSGKSNLLDVILFGLFDKCSRGEREDLITSGTTSMYVKVYFQIGEVNYLIHRHGKQQKSGKTKIDVNFSSDSIDLTGENRYGTNKEIVRLIGTYEDFVLTTLRLQEGLVGNLIRLSNSQRKDRLTELLRLDIFDQYAKLANEELKTVKKSIEVYQRELSQTHTSADDLETQLASVLDSLIETKSALNFSQARQEKLREELTGLNARLQPVDNDLANQEVRELPPVKLEEIKGKDEQIELLHREVTKLQDRLKPLFYKQSQHELEDNIDLYRDFIDKEKKKLAELRSEIKDKEILLEGFRKTRGEYQEQLTSWEELVGYKLSLESWLKTCYESNKKLLSLEYDPKCDYCMNNVFVKDARKCQAELKEKQKLFDEVSAKVSELESIRGDLRQVEMEIDTLQNELRHTQFHKLEEDLNTYKKELRQLHDDYESLRENQKIQRKMNQMQDTLQDLRMVRDRLWAIWAESQQMEQVLEHKRRRKENEHLVMEIARLEEQYNEVRQTQSDLEPKLLELTGQEHRLSVQFNQVSKWQKELETLRPRKDLLELYIKCFGKDGLPKFLIGKYLPAFERIVNLILEDLVDFRIRMEICDKKWNIYVIYPDGRRNVDLCSGYEKFMIDVATKVALQNLSQISQPQFMVIDEGFGSLDNKNLGCINGLFNYLRSHYQFILLITHVDAIKDDVDRQIEVKRVDGWSKLDFDRAQPKKLLSLRKNSS